MSPWLDNQHVDDSSSRLAETDFLNPTTNRRASVVQNQAESCFYSNPCRDILLAEGTKTMTTEQVENEALKLKPQARAELAEKLLRSLEDLSDEDIERLWAEEAVRRDGELDSGEASMRDAEDVFRDARARIS
jgi:hypothetical protein